MLRAAPRLLLALLVFAPAIAGCLGGPDEADALGTFYPMTFLLEEIAGDVIAVGQLVPEGVEPHDWEPSVHDIARLQDARLVVAVSPRLETYLATQLAALGTEAPDVFYTARAHAGEDDDHDDHDGMTEEEWEAGNHSMDDGHGHGAAPESGHDLWGPLHDVPQDPHTWLDPVALSEEARLLGEALAEVFPAHRPTIEQRAADLALRLADFSTQQEQRLADCRIRHAITQHDSFGHLGARYNITFHSVSGLSPQAEPDAATVRRIVDTMRDHGIQTVFVDAETRPAVMAAIAAETGATVRTLSPLEFRTIDERRTGDDYFDIMRRNIEALAAAMECA